MIAFLKMEIKKAEMAEHSRPEVNRLEISSRSITRELSEVGSLRRTANKVKVRLRTL